MRKGKVFFHPIEGTGQLGISWSAGPKGDAIEAKKGEGVGFFSSKGELLSVLFDEVQEFEDHQTLEFAHYKVEVFVKDGIVSYKLTQPSPKKPLKKAIVKPSTRKRLKRSHRSKK
jgi:hypothetical protein